MGIKFVKVYYIDKKYTNQNFPVRVLFTYIIYSVEFQYYNLYWIHTTSLRVTFVYEVK